MTKNRQELTPKEDELMQIIWNHGPLFVREMVGLYPDPKPHFNTVATVVKILEQKGYVAYESVSGSFRYHALPAVDEYRRRSLGNIIRGFFGNSYLGAVSCLVEEEKVSLDELRELIEMVESNHRKQGEE